LKPTETVQIVRLIRALCPAQHIDEYSADAWHEVIGDLDFRAARDAVIAVKHGQPFVDPSDIVRRVRGGRRPDGRTVAEALAQSNERAAITAGNAPVNAEYLAAKEALIRKLEQRINDALARPDGASR
jgi:hypothetical protein